MLTKILAGVALSLALALAGTGYWLSNVIASRATVRASLNTALEANATLITDRDRYRTSAAAEAERAGQRLRERDGLAAQVATLRQSLGDSLGACQWTDEQARAVDEFIRGGK